MIPPTKNVKEARLSLPCWLEEQINSGEYKGLKWVERSRREFTVPWKHASRHGWLEAEDASLFKAWAVYTRRYREEYGDPDPKKWKANFRCAVNACPDITALKTSLTKRGKNAYRVFKFEKNRRSKKYVTPRNPGIKLTQAMKTASIKLEKDGQQSENNQYRCSQQRTTPTVARRMSARTSNRIRIKTEEELDEEVEDSNTDYMKLPTPATIHVKVEPDDGTTTNTAKLPSCQDLSNYLEQQQQKNKRNALRKKASSKYKKDALKSNGNGSAAKDIKWEHIDWSAQITMKDMLQLPKPGEFGLSDSYSSYSTYPQQQLQQNNRAYFHQSPFINNNSQSLFNNNTSNQSLFTNNSTSQSLFNNNNKATNQFYQERNDEFMSAMGLHTTNNNTIPTTTTTTQQQQYENITTTTPTSNVFSLLIECLQEMVDDVKEEEEKMSLSSGDVDIDLCDELYTSGGSDDESVIRPCRLSSVNSSLSNEDLEKMLSLPENTSNESHYEEMECVKSQNSMDNFGSISTTYTDPFLSNHIVMETNKNLDLQAYSDVLRSDYIQAFSDILRTDFNGV